MENHYWLELQTPCPDSVKVFPCFMAVAAVTRLFNIDTIFSVVKPYSVWIEVVSDIFVPKWQRFPGMVIFSLDTACPCSLANLILFTMFTRNQYQ